MLFKANDDELYQGYLAKVYSKTCGYERYTAAVLEKQRLAGICLTYGELNYYSVKKICRLLKLTLHDVFLDLGSGLGKCALQVFMQTDVGRVIGIEAAPKLVEQALLAQLQLQADFPFYWEDDRSLHYLGENFPQCDWQGATAVYSCSTCFTQELLVAIGDRINSEKSVTKVLSLRPLPTLERLKLHRVFAVECSWDSALCYYYRDDIHEA